MSSITYNDIRQNRSNCFLKPTTLSYRKRAGETGLSWGPSCSSTERTRSRVDRATGPRPARAPHPRQRAIQKARPDLGIGHAVMLPDSNRSSIWTGELKPAPLGSDARRGAPEAQRPARLLLAAIVAIARAAGFPMLVMSRIRHAAIGLGGCGPGSPDGCGCEQQRPTEL